MLRSPSITTVPLVIRLSAAFLAVRCYPESAKTDPLKMGMMRTLQASENRQTKSLGVTFVDPYVQLVTYCMGA